jgi:integrase
LALSQGEKWDMVQRNEAKPVNVPKVPRKEQNTPPPERVRALIEAAAVSGTPEMATIIALAALTGMRRGELCGLQWCDINWEESSLTVRHAIWETSGGKAGMKDPKSHQIRHIDLSVHAMAVLTGRWQRVVGAANVAEIELPEDAFVVSPQVDGLKWMRPGNITLAFGRLCKRMEEAAREDAEEAGRKLQPSELWAYRFHDLRRYTATELFRAGHNARTVSDRLGHSEPGFTLRVYTGGTSDQSKAAAAALDIGLTG